VHNRYYIPSPDSPHSLDHLDRPYVSIDKITARIQTADPCRITGRIETRKFAPNWFWFNVPTGKVGVWSCGLNNEVFLTFNPSTIDHGHNVFPYTGDALEAIQSLIPDLLRRFPKLPLHRPEMTLLRAGYSEMSEIHLSADFEFPSYVALVHFIRELKLRWTWRWNRRTNDNYATTFYLNQGHWDLLVYSKEDEVNKNHSNWPHPVKLRCRNRLPPRGHQL
jgi:hypothetical protein